MTRRNDLSPATLAAQGLGWIEPTTRALVPPVHTATTFERAPDNTVPGGRTYARAESPAFDQAEALLAALEGGEGAMLFASGMAAATAVFQVLAPGDHVVLPQAMYWSLRRWAVDFCEHWSGSRPRPTRCGASPILPRRRRSPTPRAPGWRSTARRPHLC
jgi:cystathionine gamma-synthase